MIAIVGSKNGEYHFLREGTVRVNHEDDPNSLYYEELCGHRWLLSRIDSLMDEPYLGLEHYRRRWMYTPAEIDVLLDKHDIIVKGRHGPFPPDTNLTVLRRCSRYHLDYSAHATEWVNRWPELRKYADDTTHYGCNMILCRPQKYGEMMEDEFGYVEAMLRTPGVQRAEISYFTETILSQYIIHKYNADIFVGQVVMPC